MAPTSAAVRANNNRSGLTAWVRALVWPGAIRMALKADSAPATVQVKVEVRRIQTPERRAESAFSDMARIERPQVVQLTATTSAMATTGPRSWSAPGPG